MNPLYVQSYFANKTVSELCCSGCCRWKEQNLSNFPMVESASILGRGSTQLSLSDIHINLLTVSSVPPEQQRNA